MKRFIKFSFVMLVAVVSIQATCGVQKPFSKAPEQVLRIKDHVYFHNVSIAYDGHHYFTLNGGNSDYCTINEYTREGKFVEGYDVGLDGRFIMYNPADDRLYVKVYGTDLYSIDLKTGGSELALSDVFDGDNSSLGFSPDGEFIYEINDGEIRTLNFKTGKEVKSFQLEKYFDEHGYKDAIAASEKYLFVWAAEDEVEVYNMNGEFVAKVELPRAGYGFSLSYCNRILWIAKDADASSEGGYGYWYGFRL